MSAAIAELFALESSLFLFAESREDRYQNLYQKENREECHALLKASVAPSFAADKLQKINEQYSGSGEKISF